MPEVITLPTPVPKPAQTTWKADRWTFDFTAGTAMYQYLGDNGEALSIVYDATTTPTAKQVFSAINKRNFAGANPSLMKFTMQQHITDGYLAGTVGGSPD